MTMTADVLEVHPESLLVRDWESGEEVQVNLSCPCRFRPGDRVTIRYDGTMTMSIPPQISAQCIRRLCSC